MTKDKKNIDLLFGEGLKGFKEKPPVYAWNKLDKGLAVAGSKKAIIWLRLTAAVILLFLAFGAGYFYAIYLNDEKPIVVQKNSPVIYEDLNQSEEQIAENEENIGSNQNIETIENDGESIFENSTATKNNINNSIALVNTTENPKDFTEQQIAMSDEQKNIYFGEDFSITTLAMIDITAIPELNSSTLVKENQTILKEKDGIVQSNPYNPFNEGYYDDLPGTSKESKWSLGAHFAPVLSYRDITFSYDGQTYSNVLETESELNNAEQSLLSYAGGLDVYYDWSKRWSFHTGMTYSRIGQENNSALEFKQDDDQFLLFAVNTSTGNINIAFEKVPDNIRKIERSKDTIDESINLSNVKIVQNFDLFEIPIMVKYKILNKKFGINLSGGLSPAYLVNNNTFLEVGNDKYDIGDSDNLNSVIINTSFSLGINYSLFKKLTLNVEPNFKYSLSPINKNNQFDYHPYYFSFFTGIVYKL